MLHYVLPVLRCLHAVQRRDGGGRRPHHIRLPHHHLKGIGQRICLPQRVQKELLIPQPLLESCHGRFLIHERHPFDALHPANSRLHLGPLLLGRLILEIDADLHLGFQRIHHFIHIHHNDEKHAENKERHRYRADGGESHPAVAAQRKEDLADDVFARPNFHSRIPPALRRGQYARLQWQ